ncbi:YcaO-like family protein [Paenarthrobacter aromaticivorans]|uniref:YcaO-like family protein n=1 Tax=Paenarthrobacter aromaticivorans TaxID=2849150 RepID=UPI003A811D42
MSVDPVLTLDPSLGLVSSATVYLPNDVGLWRTVASLANGLPRGEGFATAVGAFDVRKRASITRGAGEAVERFALMPAEADVEHLVVPRDQTEGQIDFVSAGLGRASALAFEFPWYRATNLLTGQESYVPAPTVDYTAGGSADRDPWSGFFDPSPNGAASGPSERFAQVSGIGEVIERDAFLSAWRRRAPLNEFVAEEMPADVRDSQGTLALFLLVDSARAAGVDFTLAFIPQDDSPLHVAVCIITGHAGNGQFGAVGLKAAAGPIVALRGALQEGLQIRELFLSRTPSAAASPEVTDDESRADFWTTEQALAELSSWLRSFKPARFPAFKPTPEVKDLVKCLARRDIQSHWVSLTHRLPAAIRELGWMAGKAICPGAVPLTMDETKGVLIPHGPAGLSLTPHPLI